MPAFFAQRISLAAHQKAADYSTAQLRLGQIELFVGAALLLAWTLFGGLQWLNTALLQQLAPGLVQQMALLMAFVVISALLDLPFDAWRTFVLEAKFGFNKTSWQLWLGDMFKGALLGAVIGLPILALVLWLMAQAGSWWWQAQGHALAEPLVALERRLDWGSGMLVRGQTRGQTHWFWLSAALAEGRWGELRRAVEAQAKPR